MTQHKPCRAFITTNNGRFNKITDKHKKYTAEISQISMHILYKLLYIKRSRSSMNIKKNEKSEAAELKVCISKLSDWQESSPRSFLAHTVST